MAERGTPESYGNGWNDHNFQAFSPPSPTNSDYIVHAVPGSFAPTNTLVTPANVPTGPAFGFDAAAAAVAGGSRPLTPVRSDILDEFDSSNIAKRLQQQQSMNTSGRLEFPANARAPFAAPDAENSSLSSMLRNGFRRTAKKTPKVPCAGCPFLYAVAAEGQGSSRQQGSSKKKCQDRQENSPNSSRRRHHSGSKRSLRKLGDVNRGSSPRYVAKTGPYRRPVGLRQLQGRKVAAANAKIRERRRLAAPEKLPISPEEQRGFLVKASPKVLYPALQQDDQRPVGLRLRQADVVAAKNANLRESRLAAEALPITPEEQRGLLVKVLPSVLYRALQQEQAERVYQEQLRKALGSPIPFDIHDDSNAFVSSAPPKKQQEEAKKSPIAWNQRKPKNFVLGISHAWQQQHPGWESGKYRLKFDSSSSRASGASSAAENCREVASAAISKQRRSSRSKQQQMGTQTDRWESPRSSCVQEFVEYQINIAECRSRRSRNN